MADSLSDRLQQAMAAHVAGRHADSELRYRQLVADYPDAPAPRHYLGFLLQQSGRLDEAYELIAQSLRLDATHAEWHFNFGLLLARLDRAEEAVAALLTSLQLDARQYFCWTNLGALFERLGEPEQAEQAYRVATTLDAGRPDAFHLLASLLTAQERFDEARYFSCRGVVVDPVEGKSRLKLIQALNEVGEAGQALAVLEDWLTAEPDNSVAAHLLHAHRSHEPPQRCSDAYVVATFDSFAASFDSTLGRLKYRGPALLAAELARLDVPPHSMDVLDLGCGTGLSGASLRPVARRLTGIDLSRGMLDRARDKQLYDVLCQVEIGAYLDATHGQFDLIACIDAVIYFGDLAPLFRKAYARLARNGVFIFTTEEAASGSGSGYDYDYDYALDTTGRYRHRPAYVAQAAAAAGFQPARISDVVLRNEFGRPATGQLVCLRKPPG